MLRGLRYDHGAERSVDSKTAGAKKSPGVHCHPMAVDEARLVSYNDVTFPLDAGENQSPQHRFR